MAAKSVYASNRTLEYLIRTTPVYVALFTTLPNPSNAGGVEVTSSGTAYSRKAVNFNAASAGQCISIADLIWPQASARWGDVAGFGIYDALTAGNQLYASLFPGGPVTIDVSGTYGDQFLVPSGTLTVNES